MKIKRPKTIYFLLILFAWAFIQTLAELFRYANTLTYQLLDYVGVSILYFPYTILLLTLQVFVIVFLWKPRPLGYLLGIGTSVFMLISGVLIYGIALLNTDTAQKASILSRESRGLPVREGSVESIFSQEGIIITLIFLTIFTGIIIFSFIAKKSYFYNQPLDEMKHSLNEPAN